MLQRHYFYKFKFTPRKVPYENETRFLLSCILLLICPKIFALNFHKSEETLNRITEIISKKEKGVYLRFGDGDVFLANGQEDKLSKKQSFLATREMREAFSLNGHVMFRNVCRWGCKEFEWI